MVRAFKLLWTQVNRYSNICKTPWFNNMAVKTCWKWYKTLFYALSLFFKILILLVTKLGHRWSLNLITLNILANQLCNFLQYLTNSLVTKSGVRSGRNDTSSVQFLTSCGSSIVKCDISCLARSVVFECRHDCTYIQRGLKIVQRI